MAAATVLPTVMPKLNVAVSGTLHTYELARWMESLAAARDALKFEMTGIANLSLEFAAVSQSSCPLNVCCSEYG